MSNQKPILEWDPYEMVQRELKYIRENPEEYQSYRGISDEKIIEDLYSGEFLQDMWEYLTDDLTEIMQRKNHRNYYKNKWYAEVNSFGWRNSDGSKTFTAETGQELLQEILPKTDCIFKIFRDSKSSLKIQNYHHDSPTGNEWYYIRPMTKKEVENPE